MTARNPTSSVNAFLPIAKRISHATVTLGTGETLATHFSPADVAAAEFLWITPHAATCWILFGGSSDPAASDGHSLAAGVTRELAVEGLDEVKFTGSGACTITLFRYARPGD